MKGIGFRRRFYHLPGPKDQSRSINFGTTWAGSSRWRKSHSSLNIGCNHLCWLLYQICPCGSDDRSNSQVGSESKVFFWIFSWNKGHLHQMLSCQQLHHHRLIISISLQSKPPTSLYLCCWCPSPEQRCPMHHQDVDSHLKNIIVTCAAPLARAYYHHALAPCLKTAQDMMNQLTINLDSKMTEMLFLDVALATLCLHDRNTWGCPCYILDSRLQTNPKRVLKWEPQAWLGIYVGQSPHHAGNKALVLNPNTGLISPQFHVAFDDDFTTVPHLRKWSVPPNWANLVWSSSEKTTAEFYDSTKTWVSIAI